MMVNLYFCDHGKGKFILLSWKWLVQTTVIVTVINVYSHDRDGDIWYYRDRDSE